MVDSTFCFPHTTGQHCFWLVTLVLEQYHMVIATLFPFILRYTYITFIRFCWYWCNAFTECVHCTAFTVHWTVILLSAVTWQTLFCFCLFNSSVVTVDNLNHVLAATITYFKRIFVENVVQFVFFREMFFYQV